MDENVIEAAERAVEAESAAAVARVRAEVATRGDGICGDCGEEIEAARMAAAPFATRCLVCQTGHERRRAA